MDKVPVTFYWGGNVLQDPAEGLSYDVPPRGLYNVDCQMSLTALEEMVMHKMATNGQNRRAKFTCRFPYKTPHLAFQYKAFPMNDDETLSTLLQMSKNFPNNMEVYVHVENAYVEEDEELDVKVDSDDDPGENVMVTDNNTGIKEAKTAKKLTSKRRKVVICCASSEHSRAVEVVVSNDDLITEILFLVPAKPLLKFKCVSKHWCSLISESHFASSHACRNPSSSLISGLYFYQNKPWQLKSATLDGRLSLPTLSFLDTFRKGTMSRVVDSCNGLLLYSCGDRMHYIVCNPTTQKYIALPKSGGSTSSRSAFDPFGAYLAFDPSKSPFYKVVLIDYRYDYGGRCYVIEIYSSEIASWKVLHVKAPEGFSYRSRVFWNGAIHWMSHTNDHIRFDIDAEKLTGTPMPKVPNILAEDKIWYFGECGGRLLLIQSREHCALGFRVLEMEKDSYRWNVKCRVNLRSITSVFPHGNCPEYSVLDCVNGATEKDFTLVLAIPRKVIACNVTRKTAKVLLDLQGDSNWPFVHNYRHAFRFVESLYPL